MDFPHFHSVEALRRLEKPEKTRARFCNHPVFNLRCRDQDLTPPDPNQKCSEDHQQSKEGMDDFIQQFPTDQETQTAINAHLKQPHEQEVTITKTRQLRKLKKLIERKNNDKHRHPEINKKWMRNLSIHPFSRPLER